MGVISRSLAQGVAIGKSPGEAMKMGLNQEKIKPVEYKPSEIDDSISNADKMIKDEKSQKLELQDHHYPDAQDGETVPAKVVHNDDGTRSLDTSVANSEDARNNMINSISLNNQMTMGGGSDSSS